MAKRPVGITTVVHHICLYASLCVQPNSMPDFIERIDQVHTDLVY